MKKPSYMQDGARSIEGSSSVGTFPKMKVGLGELTPPGLVTNPSGAPSVSFAQGASTPAATNPGSLSSVASVPLTYHKD